MITFDEALVNRYQDETRRAERPDCHGGPPLSVPCQMINCFCMFSDYIPLTLDEWIDADEKAPQRENGSHFFSCRSEGKTLYDKIRQRFDKILHTPLYYRKDSCKREYGYKRSRFEAGKYIM